MGKSDDTRMEIVKSAVEIIALKGYAASTTREIAEGAGVSEATLFKYFQSKKGLLHEVVLRFIEEIGRDETFQSIDEILRESEGLATEELFRRLFADRYGLLDKNFQMLKIFIVEVQYHEDVRLVFMERIMPRIIRYAEILTGVLEKREDVRRNVDLFAAIRSFMGMVLLTVLQKKMIPELTREESQWEAEINGMIDLFIRGIGKVERA